MLLAAAQLRYFLPIVFAELLQTYGALVYLHLGVVRIELLGLLLQEFLHPGGRHPLQSGLVLRYHIRLPREDGEADEDAEATEEEANDSIEEESDANHCDEHLVQFLVLLAMVQDLEQPLGDVEAVAAKEEEDGKQPVADPDHRCVVVHEADAHQVERQADQVQDLVAEHEIEGRGQVFAQRDELLAIVNEDAGEDYEHDGLPGRRLIYRLLVVLFHALLDHELVRFVFLLCRYVVVVLFAGLLGLCSPKIPESQDLQ